MSRVVVTGAAGRLGTELVRRFTAEGHEVLGVDRVPAAAAEHPHLVLELAETGRLTAELRPDDVVAHAASIHPCRSYADAEYFESNCAGTWHLYASAEAAGVRNVVLTSSTAASGNTIPLDLRPVAPSDRYACTELYSLTKQVQEDIAAAFSARSGIRTLALRPAGFIPVEPLKLGFCLTHAWTSLEDVVEAHTAAVAAILAGRSFGAECGAIERLFVSNRLPYRAEDASLIAEDGDYSRLVERHWPEAHEWLVRRGFRGESHLAVYDIEPTIESLGWRPTLSFDDWFLEHSAIL